MGHRAGYTVGSPPAGLSPGPGGPAIDPRYFRGFSYFLGEPTTATRTTIGADPAKARALLQALYSLLPIAPNVDNPRIPSGYTYLLQFVAHDLVETTVPFWAAAEAGVPSRNVRDETLGLDTLYGGGPTACPIAFEPAGYMVDYRTRLRVGRVSDTAALGQTTPACPFRDLARLTQETPPPPPGNVGKQVQVHVADERSDDNTLLSQIVVLFSIVHNAIAAKLAPLGPQASFSHATTAVLAMYHAIIRHDLLQRLLHEPVYNILKHRPAGSPDWLWKGHGIPLEFSHGAFRVGHAMVRPFYQVNTTNKFDINQILGGPVVGDPVRDPLPSNWIVEWQRFFEFGSKPNYSLKLAIHQQLPLNFVGEFQPVAANSPDRLTMRDWLSAADARMVRLDALIDAVKPHYPGLTPMNGAAIEKWLTDLVKTSLGTAAAKATVTENIKLLMTDLPLPLYILLESQRDPAIGGAHLGPMGSVIVGETIFRCLTAAEENLVALIPGAKQALGEDWNKVKSVASMPDLIRLAEDWGKLKDCPQIPFIAP